MARTDREPPYERVERASGAIAGLAVAITAGVKAAMWAFAPTGLTALAITIGLKSPSLLFVAAPIVLSVCTADGAICGAARFYSWLMSRR